jgi:hypothetical protein
LAFDDDIGEEGIELGLGFSEMSGLQLDRYPALLQIDVRCMTEFIIIGVRVVVHDVVDSYQ